MSSRGSITAALILWSLVSILLAPSGAQFLDDTCDLETEFSTLVPCLPYVQMQEEDPSQDCCTRVHSVLKDHFSCICTLVDSGGGAGGMVGHVINDINFTLAQELPSMCDVRGFDPSRQCGPGATPLLANSFSSSVQLQAPPAAQLWTLALATLLLKAL